MAKINILNQDITAIKHNDGDFFISNWLRNRNTIEDFGIWEKIHNPSFNYGEFAIITSKAELNKMAIHQMQILTKDKNIQALENKL